MSLRPRPRLLLRGVAVVALATGGLTATLLAQTGARAETIVLPPSGSIQVIGNGNGHGHGMSQYGARGAAQHGLTAAQIVAFYYPGTTLATMSAATTIRVQISGATSSTCVMAKSGLTATGVSATLPTSGITRWRLVPSGTGLALQKTAGTSCTGGTWTTTNNNLPATVDIKSSQGYVRLFLSDGTSTDYRGTLGAVRSGTGEITVNRVGIDQYAQGVAPREMPASWEAAAVQAQAIAARTYGEYEREHASGAYDICDTTQCQVYGGATHYDASGNILWQDDPAAISGNSGAYLKYGTGAAFSQFSASDGGWTVAGGQPYLIAQADPYDSTAAGDPYIHWTKSVQVSQIASYYGLARVAQIQITQRDGHGEWGGRVLAGNVVGTTSSGQSTTIATTGFELQSAMGLLHNWFTVKPASTLGGTIVHSTTSSATVFWNYGGGLMMRTYVNGSGWQAAVDMGAPSTGLTWDPDASSWGDGHIDVFARDASGILVNRSYTAGVGWTGWRSNGVRILSSPAVADPVNGEGDVFWLGANHTLQTIRWTKATGWTAPAAIPGLTNANSGPDVTTLVTSKNLVVAYRGTDGKFWTVTRAGGTWGAPRPFNTAHALPRAPLNVDPSISNSGGDVPNLGYTGVDGVIYHSSDNPVGGATSPWYAVPGSGTTSAPDMWTDLPSHGDVVSGHAGVFGTASWNSTNGWRGWMPLP